MKTLRSRYQQANKEAILAILLSLGYFVWWYLSAYGITPEQVTPESLPTLYFGLPLWFLLSCIIGPIIFSILCFLMVKLFYKDISLDVTEEDNE